MRESIKFENSISQFNDKSSWKWRLYLKTERPLLIAKFILATSLLLTGLYFSYTLRTELWDGKFKYYDFNICNSLGIAIMLFTFVDIYKLRVKKSAYQRSIDSYIQAHQKLVFEISFDSTSLKFSDAESKWEILWTRVTNYYYQNGNLALFFDSNPLSSFVIKESELGKDHFHGLVKIVSENVLKRWD